MSLPGRRSPPRRRLPRPPGYTCPGPRASLRSRPDRCRRRRGRASARWRLRDCTCQQDRRSPQRQRLPRSRECTCPDRQPSLRLRPDRCRRPPGRSSARRRLPGCMCRRGRRSPPRPKSPLLPECTCPGRRVWARWRRNRYRRRRGRASARWRPPDCTCLPDRRSPLRQRSRRPRGCTRPGPRASLRLRPDRCTRPLGQSSARWPQRCCTCPQDLRSPPQRRPLR